MEEKVEVSILLSLYGSLLTETQRKYMELYYNKDLSLSEIAHMRKITRQAVQTILIKSKKKLQEYEKNLKVMGKEKKIKKLLGELQRTDVDQKQNEILNKIYKQLDF